MSDQDKTAGGSRVLRHDHVTEPRGDIAYADDEAIGHHLETTLGGAGMVWHELVSDRIHIDVHMFGATEERPYQVLVTSGMSALPMTVPDELDEDGKWSHGELSMVLPADWPLDAQAFEDERNYWPMRLLKELARLPHDFDTWLGWGHTVPNGEPAKPYAANTKLCGALVVPPFFLGDDFFELALADHVIHFFSVIPLYAAELDLKLQRGTEALLDRLDGIEELAYGPLDPRRPCVASH